MNLPCHRESILRFTLRLFGSIAIMLMVAGTVSGQGLSDVMASSSEIQNDDLIRLVTAYAEGVQEYKSAELRVKTLRALANNGNLTGLESQLAQIDLYVAQSKLEVLHAIGKKMEEAINSRVAFFRRLEQQGAVAPAAGVALNPQLRQAEADLRIIKMILAMYPIAPVTVEAQP